MHVGPKPSTAAAVPQAGAGERLVIMDVFAPWCAACKALYPKVRPLPTTGQRADDPSDASTPAAWPATSRLSLARAAHAPPATTLTAAQRVGGHACLGAAHGRPCDAPAPMLATHLWPTSSLLSLFIYLSGVQLMKLMEERPDVLLLTVNFDENKTVVKAMGVKVCSQLAGSACAGLCGLKEAAA